MPLWHPRAEFFGIILVIQGHIRGRKVILEVQNKMATRYFKVKYDFSTNEARNKCNTSFSCDFDWAIRFLYYFYDSRSSSMSKRLFQGQIRKISFLTIKARNMCNTSFSWDFVSKLHLLSGRYKRLYRSKGVIISKLLQIKTFKLHNIFLIQFSGHLCLLYLGL